VSIHGPLIINSTVQNTVISSSQPISNPQFLSPNYLYVPILHVNLHNPSAADDIIVIGFVKKKKMRVIGSTSVI
jgi:hypothetical protein